MDKGQVLGTPDGVLINGRGPYSYDDSVPRGVLWQTFNVMPGKHASIHTCRHAWLHTSVHPCIHPYMHIDTNSHTKANIHTHIEHRNIHTSLHIYANVYTKYSPTQTKTHTHTHAHARMHTHTQTHTHTHHACTQQLTFDWFSSMVSSPLRQNIPVSSVECRNLNLPQFSHSKS